MAHVETDGLPGEGHHARAVVMIGLIAVTAFALGIRLYRLDAESLWLDEGGQVSTYRLPIHRVVMGAVAHSQPPLDYLIGAGLYRLGLEGGDWWVRFPAALFGTASVFLLGWWVWRMAGLAAGLAAAGLLAVCPLHVVMSQEARPYMIFFFFALAAVLSFSHARRCRTFWTWALFGACFLGVLLSRWFGSHVLAVILVAYVVGAYLVNRRGSDPRARGRESLKLWASLGVMAAAFAVVNPLSGLILTRSRPWITPVNGATIQRLGRIVPEAWHAILGGDTRRFSFGATDNSLFVALVTFLVAVGMFFLFRRLWRTKDPLTALFAGTMLTFPLLYAVLFARLTWWPLAPQYMLLMAVPLCGCVAIAADSVRRRLAHGRRVLPWLAFGLVVAAVWIPMGRRSLHVLDNIDKLDWRGVMTHLRQHAGPDDLLVSIRPYDSPRSMGAYVVGADHYLGDGAEFLQIGFDPKLGDLEGPAWTGSGNTVWMVCNYARCDGRTLPPLPSDAGHIQVHDFAPLLLLEVRGDGPATGRLMDGLAILDRDRPPGDGLVVANLYRAAYYLSRGKQEAAAGSIRAARRQCSTEAVGESIAQFMTEADANRFVSMGPAD